MIDVRQLEQVIGEAIGETRRELLGRIERLEISLSLERRLAALESGVAKDDTVAARIERGEPVGEATWLKFVAQMQRRDPGQWRPEYASWRNGGT